MPTPNAALVTDVFPYGVASGDLTPDSVVLWTKTATPGGEVAWWCEPVSADGDGGGQRRSGTAVADPTTGSVHVLVDGIGGEQQYRYGFTAGAEASPEGDRKSVV